jgi:twitching motility two-component system response regulator PilH
MTKVLIVDDSLSETNRFTQILEKSEYQVITASCGEDGVRIAKEQLPDLALMDFVMPRLNGFQSARQLPKNASTKDIPIIMVTTKNQETDKVWGRRQGAKAYPKKPAPEALLAETINQLMS